MKSQLPLPSADLDHVVQAGATLWPELKGARLFVTGATGFFGRWLLETLLAANRRHRLGVHITALSRTPDKFQRFSPHLAERSELRWMQGSVTTLGAEAAAGRNFDFVIHLATEADTVATLADRRTAVNVIAQGTQRSLEFAARTGARRFLFTSSGSVYGRQPWDMPHLPETFECPSDMAGVAPAYVISGEAKREAERLCLASGLTTVIARGFTFAGPGMPLEGKFAFGNFLRDALAGRPIEIQGDGTPVRSYLYAADLAVCLWVLLLRGVPGRVYNIGSEHAVTLRELADLMVREVGGGGVRIGREPIPGTPPHRYVPLTERARTELGLRETVDLLEAIRRTAAWVRRHG